MDRKATYIVSAQNKAALFIQVSNKMIEMKEIWDNEGYASGGDDPIIDADCSPYGLTAAEMADFITACSAVKNLMNIAAVGAGIYAKMLDKIRNDIN